MKRFLKWLDEAPLVPLAFVALFMAVLPLGMQPHLVEKIIMLFSGTLSRPIDIFDLIMHGSLVVLVAIKLYRMFRSSGAGQDGSDSAQ